ncbi:MULTISPECIES: S8 family serine peptidase [unclassified Nocardioides]|uniref:S8 family serine peptidase n=1 Tax=unclassified Nocardioides TaxID=2615069 RepID=UPI000A26AE0F|nr:MULTISPECIES: S8 family serine peptidase [unclassified Nocardioides]
MAARGAVRRAAAAVAVACALSAAALVASGPALAGEPGPDHLYLVTLVSPGTAASRPGVPDLVAGSALRAEQESVLAGVGSPVPVYRWTTALNGVAVHLTRDEAAELTADPRVALVEKNAVRPLAGRSGPTRSLGAESQTRGGAGVVIGVVDSGIWPDSPVFSAVPGMGRAPKDFQGQCETGEGWPASTCNRKLVGARWFVDGFGVDRLRSSSSLSPADDDGHGSQMASIAAGNAGVTARVHGQRVGTYAGVAPQARLAVYKACWTAPDPDDDGCATADLVTAIDEATADGVDVLDLAVGGSPGFDTVERALLGAAESDVVVVGAAGNAARATAAHASPWVTTVGATTGAMRRGEVVLGGAAQLVGAMSADQSVGPAPMVLGADVATTDATRAEARVCTPGSLDAARVGGRIVLCDRGEIGRVDKSAAVARADGVGMVLVNVAPGNLAADFHSVPTVHVDRTAGRTLKRWLAGHPDGRAMLEPLGRERRAPRVAPWSSSGNPDGVVVKPDVVALGSGVLGAVPPAERGLQWDLVSGTSAATALTGGAAARLVSRHPDWSAAAVRSALATTAHRLSGEPVLDAGAGRVAPEAALRPGLVYDVAPGAYRAWLTGALSGDLNTPSILLSGSADTAERTITNVTGRRLYFSSRASGFEQYDVRVTPAAVRLGPGESATFTVTVDRSGGVRSLDDGWVTWRGATGTVTRIPVVLSR